MASVKSSLELGGTSSPTAPEQVHPKTDTIAKCTKQCVCPWGVITPREYFCCAIEIERQQSPRNGVPCVWRVLHVLAWLGFLLLAIGLQAGPAFYLATNEYRDRASANFGGQANWNPFFPRAVLCAAFVPIALWVALPTLLACIKVKGDLDEGKESLCSRLCFPMEYSRTGTRGLENLLVLQGPGFPVECKRISVE